jgi:hypothetical protein
MIDSKKKISKRMKKAPESLNRRKLKRKTLEAQDVLNA